MKQFILSIMGIVLLMHSTHAQEYDKQKKSLIVYFSATGTTAGVAKNIAEITGGELYEIVPQTPYTSADLNWRNKQSRSSVEMKDPASRPAIKGKKENIADYDVIFIGYPIWWNVAPVILNTFIESHHLQGKTVMPFATSGSSSIDNSVAELKKRYPEINWKNGKRLNNADKQTITEWLKKELKEQTD